MTRQVGIAIGGLLIIVAVAALALFLAGGDDDDPDAAEPVSTIPTDEFGPAPLLGDYVLEVFPPHAAAIEQELTRTFDPNNPRGVCFTASFVGLDANNALWFRTAIDDQEVTDSPGATWIVESRTADGGTFCYASEEGLEVGIHSAAVSVSDPTRPSAEPRQIVDWKFEVIE